ncbi:hypothetical protein [Sinorhizobium medicae]
MLTQKTKGTLQHGASGMRKHSRAPSPPMRPNIENPQSLSAMLKDIAHKHASLGV